MPLEEPSQASGTAPEPNALHHDDVIVISRVMRVNLFCEESEKGHDLCRESEV